MAKVKISRSKSRSKSRSEKFWYQQKVIVRRNTLVKYECPTSFVQKIWSRSSLLLTDRRTDGQTDGQTDGVIPIYPHTSFAGVQIHGEIELYCVRVLISTFV